MSRLQQRFEQQLRDKGLRVTPERVAVLTHAFRHFGHFSAAELVKSMQDHGFRVSRATVYRTLAHLVEYGFLRRHEIADRQAFYEPDFGRMHHEHLVCVRCGQILEFVQDEIERLQDEVCRRHRFEPMSHTLQIHGVCASCQRREAESPPRPAAGGGGR